MSCDACATTGSSRTDAATTDRAPRVPARVSPLGLSPRASPLLRCRMPLSVSRVRAAGSTHPRPHRRRAAERAVLDGMAADVGRGVARLTRPTSRWRTALLRRDAEELRGAVDEPRPDRVRAAQRLHRDRDRHGPRQRAVQSDPVGRHLCTSASGVSPPASRREQRPLRGARDADAAAVQSEPARADDAVRRLRHAAGGDRRRITTRAASEAFFIAGTNRAMFRFTLMNHLCMDMEQVHDTTRPPDRIRQDVTRSPGGDSRVFLNNCIGCHSGMDPMAQAFAYYNFDETSAGSSTRRARSSRSTSTTTTTFAGLRRRPTTTGTTTGGQGQNALLGWDPTLPGSGQRREVARSRSSRERAFARCQVQKVFRRRLLARAERCGRPRPGRRR